MGAEHITDGDAARDEEHRRPAEDGRSLSDLADEILDGIGRAGALYERLVLVVAPAGSGKTGALLDVADRTGHPYLNINLVLSQLLLDIPRSDRPLMASRLLDQILDEPEDTVLLDNLEILFAPSLQIQPLNWLRRASRSRIIVASWNGAIHQGHLTYAEHGHPEYRREAIGDVVVAPTPGRA